MVSFLCPRRLAFNSQLDVWVWVMVVDHPGNLQPVEGTLSSRAFFVDVFMAPSLLTRSVMVSFIVPG